MLIVLEVKDVQMQCNYDLTSPISLTYCLSEYVELCQAAKLCKIVDRLPIGMLICALGSTSVERITYYLSLIIQDAKSMQYPSCAYPGPRARLIDAHPTTPHGSQ